MKFALVGYGRMGRAIEAAALDRGHRSVAVCGGEAIRSSAGAVAESVAAAEVAFEFTAAESAEANVAACLEKGVPVVCGTTGWTPSAAVERLTDGAGLIVAPNFSVGARLFFRIARAAADWIGAAGEHDPFIVEWHHRGKRDMPSGTARRLAELLVAADPRLNAVHEGGADGPLREGVLHVAAVRAGTEPGRHVVGFDGPDDQITLEHRARGRAGFARGAVLAAEWLAGRRGRHEFDDVIDSLLARGGGSGGEERR